MFWPEQRVGPRAVVLGRQPEHGRVGAGWSAKSAGIGALVADERDELRHRRRRSRCAGRSRGRRGWRPAPARGLAAPGRSGGSCATSVRTSFGMSGDEGQRVHRAAAAGEEVHRSGAERRDDPVQVVGVLIRRGLAGRVVLACCAPRPAGRRSRWCGRGSGRPACRSRPRPSASRSAAGPAAVLESFLRTS